MAETFNGTAALVDAVGRALGPTEWFTIGQSRIDAFADATLDYQWIHVDPAAAADGPFGTTIAHGYLTMSLVNYFLPQLIEVQNISMGVNYGVNKVRFPAPVPVDSQIRASGTISEVTEVAGGVQAVVTVVIELDGAEKPAAIVETVSRFID